ncbi:hypothetical protein ACN5LO_004010 [Cronobacter sakazakii]|uniref:hypothetical protein n=1 Tax=Cronobacter dublinensis TaxID=413497 RepID=UPI00142BC96B|nr:hypothetical protein [Cronobacter dublinensis]ELY4512560.1 hypothetical protein [Cronobacter dublinensis]KAB0808225.1 hypothetical protein FZI24_21780 [Cronobacter sakazakii]MDI6447162.1 hypothetical protein [Cronobacter dublinensis]
MRSDDVIFTYETVTNATERLIAGYAASVRESPEKKAACYAAACGAFELWLSLTEHQNNPDAARLVHLTSEILKP